MPLIILTGILFIYGIISHNEKNTKSLNVKRSPEDTHAMLMSMVGKSKSECRKIAKRYGGR